MRTSEKPPAACLTPALPYPLPFLIHYRHTALPGIQGLGCSHSLRTSERPPDACLPPGPPPSSYPPTHTLTPFLSQPSVMMQHCLASKGWEIIIADESHTLRTSEKPPDARHAEAAVSAVRRSRRAIFLTGTPSLSRPFDLFRQVFPGVQLLSSPAAIQLPTPYYPSASAAAAPGSSPLPAPQGNAAVPVSFLPAIQPLCQWQLEVTCTEARHAKQP